MPRASGRCNAHEEIAGARRTLATCSPSTPSQWRRLDEWQVDDVQKLIIATDTFPRHARWPLPSDCFAELRPRIVWDRTKGTVHGRKAPHARYHVSNAGTTADHGLCGVSASRWPSGRRAGRGDGPHLILSSDAREVMFMSPGGRFRFHGHVEEDGVSRHFTEAEGAALGEHFSDYDNDD